MKSLKNACLFFVLLFSYTVVAQNDSIEHYYALAKDKTLKSENRLSHISKVIRLLNNDSTHTLYLNAFDTKSYLFKTIKDYDSAVFYAKLVLDKSNRVDNAKNYKRALWKIADYNRYNSNLIDAYSYYKRIKEESLEVQDTLVIIQSLQCLSSVQNILGIPFESEASALECLKLLKTQKETPKITESKIGIYNQLGIIYKKLYYYDRALEFYEEALEIAKNTVYVNIILNNMANVYREQGALNKAEELLTKVYNNTLQIGNIKQQYLALDNLGFVQSKLNKKEGYTNLQKALYQKVQDSNYHAMYTSYMHLAYHHQDRDEKDKLKFHATKAYDLASEFKSATYKIDALALLLTTSQDSSINEYKQLTDSVAMAKLENTNKYASVKYDYATQLLISQKHELEKEKEKRLKLIYKSVGAFVLGAAVLLFFIFRLKHKKDRLLQVFTTEAQISKKVHDEVANDVYHLMTKIENNSDSKTEILDDLEDIYNKTRDISKENSAIIIVDDFANLLSDLLVSYKSEHLNVITKGLSKIDWETFSKLKKMCIYRVLQELMVNMKKHSQATNVVVTFQMLGNKVLINYKDNGVGANIKKGNGLQNAETRISDINGTITFESEINKNFQAIIKV
jgi:tetratricopeptide (TPR) repeat protein